jgi:hypothetical protein
VPGASPRPWQIWWLALGLLRRRWTVLSAAGLWMGGGTQLLELLPLSDPFDNAIAIVISTYLYFLFLVVVEVVAEGDRRGESVASRQDLGLAVRVLVTAVPVALVGTAIFAGAALLTALLILPGVWFLTRTSLTVPSMVAERRSATAGVLRSFELTARRFWLVLLTSGLALGIEEVVDAEVAVRTTSPLDDGDWAQWALGGLVSTVVICFTAPVISVTFQRLAAVGPGPRRQAPAPVDSARADRGEHRCARRPSPCPWLRGR